MTKVVDLTVRRSDFVNGRMVIHLVVCESTIEYSDDTSSEYFMKHLTLVVREGSGEFWVPIILMVVIFLIPYVLFVIII